MNFNYLHLNAASNALALKGFIPDFVKKTISSTIAWGCHTVSFVIDQARLHPLLSIYAANLGLYKLAEKSASALKEYLLANCTNTKSKTCNAWAKRSFYVIFAAGNLALFGLIEPSLKVATLAAGLAFTTVYVIDYATKAYKRKQESNYRIYDEA